MFDLLFKNINAKVALTEPEMEMLKSFFISKKLRKKEFLLHEGEVCKYTAFVEKGILRSYSTDGKATEHIIQFATEGWWISDQYSFLTGEPSAYNISALEDSEVLLITNPAMEEMMLQMPKMERYMRMLMQNRLIALHRRITGSLHHTAEEKYIDLVKNYPDILNRVPLHYIASFLGITPETLSRIRRQLTNHK